MKDIAIFIPKNLCIDNFVPKELKIDYVNYIVYLALKRQAYSDYNTERIPIAKKEKPLHFRPDYVSLNNDLLLSKTINKKYLDFLTSNFLPVKKSRSTEVLKSILYKKPYVVGKNTFQYKISATFYKSSFKIYYIKDECLKKLFNKKKSFEIENETPQVYKNRKYGFIKKYFDSNKLNINLEKSVELCINRYNTHKDYSKYLTELIKVTDFYNGKYIFFYNENTDGRIHTSITFMNKIYREYITYENKQLVEIDISNSIIYFLSKLFDNKLLLSNNNNSNSLLMFQQYLQNIDYKEVELVKSLVDSGIFYDKLIIDFKKTYEESEFEKFYKKEYKDTFNGSDEHYRKVVKKRILSMLFAEKKHFLKEQKIFNIHFPELLHKINDFKNDFGYKELSNVLFQFEAKFVLDVLARNFHKKYFKKAPIFTLHDSLITTYEYKNELLELMNETFIEFLSSAPQIKMK